MVEERLHSRLNGGDERKIADAVALAISIVSNGCSGPRIRDVSTGRTDPVGATWRLPGEGAVSMSISDKVRFDVHAHSGGCVSLREHLRIDQRNAVDPTDPDAIAALLSDISARVASASSDSDHRNMPALATLTAMLPAFRSWSLEATAPDRALYSALSIRMPSPYANASGTYWTGLAATRIQSSAWMRTGGPTAQGEPDGELEAPIARWLDAQIRISAIRPATLEAGHASLRRSVSSAWAIEPVDVTIDSMSEGPASDPIALVRTMRDIGPLRLMAA